MEISTPIEAGRARAPLPMALVVGTLMLAAIVLVSLGAPWLAQYDFDAMDAAARMLPPSPQHWLGTDEFGRDVFSRVLYGGTTSILLGVSATALSFVVGVPLGLLAGYLRGWIDDTVMRAVDIVISVPPVMLGLLILASTDPSLWKAALAVGIIYTPIMIRLARGMTLSLANEEFITAARARGEGWPGSCCARSCPTPCRPWWWKRRCASASPSCWARCSASLGWARNRRPRTGA
ncbi:ABC transporter protein inner membrane protein [Bordetella pertussis]|nr:ABC transporter protein inner membrane protein [Bordetella pertussis]